ncbi:TetR family transcriptional regulator [Proteus mirabilis]|nr:TetR family transcriptional regulator [Proteus mirabilis]
MTSLSEGSKTAREKLLSAARVLFIIMVLMAQELTP